MSNAEQVKRWAKNNPKRWAEITRKANKKYTRKLRKRALEVLGGKCVICGINDFRCLNIDHINNDGYKERKPSNIGANAIRRWIVKNPGEAKKKYQVLCANHNMIKHFKFAYPDIYPENRSDY